MNNQSSFNKAEQGIQLATFGTGCFWCTEAQFSLLKGVNKVTSGYTGGHTPNPTYKEVCTGNTGHAEVVQIEYNADSISYIELLEAFFASHDPTSLNRQGNDIGTQYRSAIFYHNEYQKNRALAAIEAVNNAKVYNLPIVTEVTQFAQFYPAEDYHNNYYNLNKNETYCVMVVGPKVEKFREIFKDRLKK